MAWLIALGYAAAGIIAARIVYVRTVTKSLERRRYLSYREVREDAMSYGLMSLAFWPILIAGLVVHQAATRAGRALFPDARRYDPTYLQKEIHRLENELEE